MLTCSKCKREAVAGKKRCQHHLDLHSRQSKRSYERRYATGLCKSCGKVPPLSKRKMCVDCAGKAARRLSLRRELQRLTKPIGQCRRCNNVAMVGKSLCIICVNRRQDYRIRLKNDAFNAYGGIKYSCEHCPEKTGNIEFLTIDHINGGGNDHRRQIGRGGVSIYRWLKNNQYPSGYRVLCYNCNAARYHNGGICPHQNTNLL